MSFLYQTPDGSKSMMRLLMAGMGVFTFVFAVYCVFCLDISTLLTYTVVALCLSVIIISCIWYISIKDKADTTVTSSFLFLGVVSFLFGAETIFYGVVQTYANGYNFDTIHLFVNIIGILFELIILLIRIRMYHKQKSPKIMPYAIGTIIPLTIIFRIAFKRLAPQFVSVDYIMSIFLYIIGYGIMMSTPLFLYNYHIAKKHNVDDEYRSMYEKKLKSADKRSKKHN